MPFPTTSTITQHPKWVRELDASVYKTARLPVKLSELSTDEEFYGAYPIREEIQETQDPTATTSDAPSELGSFSVFSPCRLLLFISSICCYWFYGFFINNPDM